jgi:hypothetical protein
VRAACRWVEGTQVYSQKHCVGWARSDPGSSMPITAPLDRYLLHCYRVAGEAGAAGGRGVPGERVDDDAHVAVLQVGACAPTLRPSRRALRGAASLLWARASRGAASLIAPPIVGAFMVSHTSRCAAPVLLMVPSVGGCGDGAGGPAPQHHQRGRAAGVLSLGCVHTAAGIVAVTMLCGLLLDARCIRHHIAAASFLLCCLRQSRSLGAPPFLFRRGGQCRRGSRASAAAAAATWSCWALTRRCG